MPLQLPSCDPQPLAPGLYTTDAFHRRPLLAVKGQLVCSWDEAHALHGPAQLEDVNPAYVAALISGHHNAEAAPYKRIKRLPRSHYVHLRVDGAVQTSAYDPLAGGASAMQAEALHEFLQQGLIDHVQHALERHPGPIGCEHSSGLDSNAVLGALVHGVGVEPERIHTWSNEEGGEGALLQEFRLFHRLKSNQCHRFESAKAVGELSLDHFNQQLAVLGAPAQIGHIPQAVALMRQLGCTVLFSGLGGDQAISHNASNVPTDLVAQCRWHELRQWMGGTRVTLKIAASRATALSCRPWAMNKVMRRTRDFCTSDLLIRALTTKGKKWLTPYIKQNYPWDFDVYLRQNQSIRRRVLADWVAVRAEEESRLAANNGIAKVFPLLDEKLIATLLQQDPLLFGESAGCGRLLHRRAFANFLPPFLRENPTKKREPNSGLKDWHTRIINNQLQTLERRMLNTKDWHSGLFSYWDVEVIRREAENILSSTNPTIKETFGTNKAMACMNALNSWWQSLDG